MKNLINLKKEKLFLVNLLQINLPQILGCQLLSFLIKQASQKKLIKETPSLVEPLQNHLFQLLKHQVTTLLLKKAGQKTADLQQKQNLIIQDSILSFLESSHRHMP